MRRGCGARTTRACEVAVLTNNGTPWASEVAKDLGVPCIPRARKPLPSGFRRAVKVLELEARRVRRDRRPAVHRRARREARRASRSSWSIRSCATIRGTRARCAGSSASSCAACRACSAPLVAADRIAQARARLDAILAQERADAAIAHHTRWWVGDDVAPTAVVLLHGLTNSPPQYDALAPLLHARGHAVIVPRLPLPRLSRPHDRRARGAARDRSRSDRAAKPSRSPRCAASASSSPASRSARRSRAGWRRARASTRGSRSRRSAACTSSTAA